MERLKGHDGISLDEQEQAIWARANTSSKNPLSEEDLKAIAREHTADVEDEHDQSLRIPASSFDRANEVLGKFICLHEGLSEWGGNTGSFTGKEQDMSTAMKICLLIQDGTFPLAQ